MSNAVDVVSRLADLRAGILAALLGEADWEAFLADLAGLLPNGAATLFYHDSTSDRGAFSIASGLGDAALGAYAGHYSALNPWMAAATRRPIGLSVPDSAMLNRRDLLATEFYNDFLAPHDLQGAIGVTLCRKDNCHFFLSVLGDTPETEERREALFVLRALVPDLRRAFTFYQRRASEADWGLAAGGHGVMRLGPGRRLYDAEGEAARQLESGGLMSVGPTGQLDFRDRQISAQVEACLASGCAPGSAPRPRTFLAIGDGGVPLKLTVLGRPWGRGARYFAGPECLVLIENRSPSPENLTAAARLYGFTRRETDVATALCAGQGTRQIAETEGIGFETVRSHLRALMEKTSTHSQVQLVALLSRWLG